MNNASRMNRYQGALLVLTLTVVSSMMIAAPALARENWVDFSPADFPASVTSVEWGSDDIFDVNRGRRWGSWHVKFNSESAILRKNDDLLFSMKHGKNMGIYGLTCDNRVMGSLDCNISLYADDMPSRRCHLNVPNPPEEPISIRITCPTRVNLER